MDGTKHREIINSWFESTVSNGGIERYDDLHVDQIDASWKPRGRWIESALESFEMALDIRDSHLCDDRYLTVVLAFALIPDSRPLGITFHSRDELEKELSSTPPSLYLFRKGTEFWLEAKESEYLNSGSYLVIDKPDGAELFGKKLPKTECVFMEYRRKGDDEYSRDVFISG